MTDVFFRGLAREASASYPRRSQFARHFAYGKLTGDPAFAHMLRASLVPDGARMLDIGSGQGLVCAMLNAARARADRGEWPAALRAPPRLSRYTGIELMARDAEWGRAMANHWGGPTATHFVVGDMRDTEFPHSDVVVILDVLHYVDYEAQAAILGRVRSALAPRGTLLLRVGDESSNLSFRYTLAIDRVVMALRGHRLPRLWCRPIQRWIEALQAMGFRVEAAPMSAGTPFANVLLVARYDQSP